MVKQQRNLRRYTTRFYTVQGQFLFYGERELKGYTSLQRVYLHCHNDNNGQYKYRISLIKDSNEVNLLTDNEQDFNKLKEQLERQCILLNFHNQYQLTKQIGKGSFASVFIAQSRQDQQFFAIKRFSKLVNIKNRNTIQQSVLNEFTIMRDLNHSNLLGLHRVFETNKHINMVLELIQGGELMKTRVGSIRDARQIAKSLLLGADYMHQKGYMHRDLKPHNILVRPNTTDVVIADFGLSTRIGLKDPIYNRCGTTGFVAPEVLDYKDGQKLYSQKCDIFSIGVIIYQLCFSVHPFKAENKVQLLKKNYNVEYSYDPSIKVPPSIKDLIDKMLSKNPKVRPSANEALHHEFFSENLAEYSSQLLNSSSAIDRDPFLSKVASWNSQIPADMKLSSFNKQNKPDMSMVMEKQKSSLILKELSPCWNKKIEIQKLPSSLSSNNAHQQQQKQHNQQGASRPKASSLFKREYDNGVKNEIVKDLQFIETIHEPPTFNFNFQF